MTTKAEGGARAPAPQTVREPDDVLTPSQQRLIAERWPAYIMPALAALVPDKNEHDRVRFQGREYLLIGSIKGGGAIATAEQYEAGEVSFAHLMPDGRILRFGEKIGTIADLQFPSDKAPAAPLAPEGKR